MPEPVPAVALSVMMGTLARLYMLRVDYRMYPSYPQAYLIHLTLGAVASFLGGVAVPAVLAKNYQAATFLALATTQFREVRTIERETLGSLEETELVPRGTGYIEGIARVFEARNYLALLTALTSSLVTYLVPASQSWRLITGGAAGLAIILVLRPAMQGLRVRDFADVRVLPIEFHGPVLMIDGVRMMNVGLPSAREIYREQGLGVVVEPRDPDSKATLANSGQRQAIVHDLSAQLGVHRDIDEPEFMPIARRDSATGKIVISIVPAERNPKAVITAVRNVPILESARRRPLASRAGRIAD